MQLFETFLFQMSLLEQIMIWIVVAAAFVSLVYAWWLRKGVLAEPKGTEQMQKVWNGIREGSLSYLDRQLKTIVPILVVLAGLLFFTVYITTPEAGTAELFDISTPEGLNYARIVVGIGRSIAFILGASFSLIVGQLGMRIAVESNIRVAQATREGENRYNKALTISYRGGTFTGMLTDGLGLLGGTVIFIIYGLAAPDALLGFGLGGTLLALFMRVGGGIYTKAADVGADLVGKVEHGLPEDDPRNAAVIADLVGDNVGDCAGMAADIFESYEVTIVSSLILAIVIYLETAAGHFPLLTGGALAVVVFPLFIRAIGVISSIVGTIMVPVWPRIFKSGKVYAEKAMFLSYEVSSLFTIILSMLLSWFYVGDIRFGILIATGVMLAVSFNPLTSYFTSLKKPPVQEIVKATETGTATMILSGIVAGYESTVAALLVIVSTFGVAWFVFTPFATAAMAPFVVVGIEGTLWTLYGIALIGIGMLSHTGNNVAMDAFGPISDNAAGIGELSPGDFDDESRKTMAELDAVGNTTKAITKGIAIASAVIAAVSLFDAFIYVAIRPLGLEHIFLDDPRVFSGLLLGAALPWLFSAVNIKAVTRAAGEMVKEVRRQFKIPGILEGTKEPDYERAVDISTTAAQKELISLTVLTVSVPIIVGLLLGVAALGGFLGGIIVSGQLLAVYMSNTGGAFDNAKKAIEDEIVDLEANTGKGSERHKSGVIGDTVGDPLKDTAGPALNPMIKVVNLLALILAPLLVMIETSGTIEMLIAAAIALFILFVMTIWAVRKSMGAADFGTVHEFTEEERVLSIE